MSEETNNTEAEEVAKPAAEAKPETPAAAPEAKQDEASAKAGDDKKAAPAGEAPAAPALNPDGTPKKEQKKDIFAEIGGGEEEVKIHKAKGSKNVARGIVHVTATFNNTLVSVTDVNGNSIGWSSAGKMGFKGSRKSTAYAAQVVSQDACRQAMGHGLKEVDVRVKGRLRSRIRCPRRPGSRSGASLDPRRHSHSAQRLPPQESPPRLIQPFKH